MRAAKLTSVIKVRLAPDVREELDRIARARELRVSDIVRQAVREYLPGRGRVGDREVAQ